MANHPLSQKYICRGLFFSTKNSLQLTSYNDVDWASCTDTHHLVTGWCTFLGNALIFWKSKKQDRVSKSSTESEHRAMSSGCSEIVWLWGLISVLGVPQLTPTSLHAENTSAIQIATNPMFYERTKHIEINCHSICEAFAHHVIMVPHISTDQQIADIFTKALSCHRHQFMIDKLMLVNQIDVTSINLWGDVNNIYIWQ